MPTANPASIDVSALTKRIPELGVRDRANQDDTAGLAEQRHNAVRPPLSSHSSERTLSPSLARTISDQSQCSYDRPGQRDSPKIQGNNEKLKKKGAGVLGFLTLKEPSTSAWEDFAKAQKKASAEKGSRRPSTAGLSGVSSRQLPDFVPATNAKWDGLPDSAKRVSMQSRNSSQPMSSFSGSTRQTSRSVWSSFSEGSGERSPARRKVAPQLPVLTAVHPALRNNAVTPWDEPPEQETRLVKEEEPQRSPETFLHPPSPNPVASEPSHWLPTPELELPEILVSGGHVTSPEPSPRTPPTEFQNDPTDSLADQYRCIRLGDQPAQNEDHGGTFWHSDTDNESEASKTSRYHAMSTPVKPSSLREMSAQWKMSPKERLGLGGKMTRRSRADQLPWESEGVPANPPAVKRLSGAQAALDGSIKLKRLSMRLGRKL
ncbi:hypothetical protein B0A55_07164 [Friedmanniomyces simplex]|uniref:Uncharacterized protein n=1 Tax=Friedmanniomyces simplex TaxID=329884 RepID=A0A4U0X6A8_9PEZI|nr:hypothetical protein B0A55_07164 [Friedmanniomyces simplex]